MAKPPKEKQKKKGKQSEDSDPAPASSPAVPPVDAGSFFDGSLGAVLFGVAVIVMVGVACWFSLDVNRVFDVPKALALKTGGCAIFAVWLVWGLFGPGWRYRSLKLFVAPVAAYTAAVIISTLLSMDVPMSIYGVYERQFGLQGFLGCVGLFVVTATTLQGRRGAVFALGLVVMVGGLIGTYALLQSFGMDPYPFFHNKPHNKVYSFLGNATFAGNSLALIFPISTMLAIVATSKTVKPSQGNLPVQFVTVLAGAAIVLLLQIVPGMQAVESAQSTRVGYFKIGVGLSVAFAFACGFLGSWGPASTRSQSEAAASMWDRLGAGALVGGVIGIVMGLLFTRTRGAWVGSVTAFTIALVLLPFLFHGRDNFKKALITCWASLAVVAVAGIVWISQAESVCADRKGRCFLWAQTIRSIPAAFDPNRTDYGKGQGTRKYLWTESPRVLVSHADTLERQAEDLRTYAANVAPDALDGVTLVKVNPNKVDPPAWRTMQVWLTGIGIETYRYAFMSHKSKRLEALDPMTNHDNPHNNYLYVLASFGILGLLTYLWLLVSLLLAAARRFFNADSVTQDGQQNTMADRMIAFGVLLSFFSYSVYSIAGFDSVACSVFFYFLLGTTASYFEPNEDDERRKLGVSFLRHFASWRGKDPTAIHNTLPVMQSALIALVLVPLLLHSAYGGIRVFNAEKAFVGKGKPGLLAKIDSTVEAIKISPHESYYKQNLGTSFNQAARTLGRQASQAQQTGKTEQAQAMLQRAQKFRTQAKAALYAALPHAWAPENIYISLFQVHYGARQMKEAERALTLALSHSPHLGPVRANLALLQLDRGAFQEALDNCQWVLEIDKKNVLSQRICGQALIKLNRLDEAEAHLKKASRLAPKDRAVKIALEELKRLRTSTTG